jgi:drug/metabolite transporter (DMT)-like permease
MATALALLASLLWGTSDFLGGTAARRLPATAVVAVSQAIALLGLVVVALASSAFGADVGYLGWALAAAVVGVVALTCFYAALAAGTMGVVAPIAAVGVVVPVAVGIGEGDRPGLLQALGVVLAFAGVFLAAGPQRDESGARPSRRPLVLAAIAAAGFGGVLVCVAHGARSSTVMTLLTMRATSVALLGLLALAGRAAISAQPRDLPLLAVIGAGDVGANAAMAVASTRGLLSVVAVLSSLYPAVTVLLARLVHAERLTRVQTVGVVAALSGVALIASGGGVGG